MRSFEILQNISQVAVAFTGFTGIVAALGHRGSGRWSSTEVLQLRTLVEPSLIALFGSFIPGTLQLAIQDEVLMWRLSNGALALIGLAGVVAFILRSRSTDTTVVQRLLVVVVVLAIGTQLLAVAGVLTNYELIFVLNLVLALVVAAHNFLLLLLPIGLGAGRGIGADGPQKDP